MFGVSSARDVDSDEGQVTPLSVMVLAVAVVTLVVIAHLGGLVVDRTRARTAADAAALAGVAGGRPGAEAQARANGATLEAWVVADGFTQVTVRVGRARATARARPGRPGHDGQVGRVGPARTEVSPRLLA